MKQYIYRDPRRVTRVLQIVVACHLAMLAVTFAVFVMQYILIQDMIAGTFSSRTDMLAAAQAGDARVQITGAIDALLIPVAAVTFLFWVYRTSANAHALVQAKGAPDLSASAGLSVGYFVIPFANFVVPPGNMSEVEKASRDAANWKQLPFWPGIALWWTTWLVMNVSGLIVAAFSLGRSGLDQIAQVVALQGGYKILEAVTWIVVLVLVARVTRLQRAQHTDAAPAMPVPVPAEASA